MIVFTVCDNEALCVDVQMLFERILPCDVVQTLFKWILPCDVVQMLFERILPCDVVQILFEWLLPCDAVQMLFEWILPPCLNFVGKYCQHILSCHPMHLTASALKLYECLLEDLK